MLSKFLNTKTLIILLVLLAGIYMISKLTEKEERTFKSELVEVDTANITKIVLIPKIGGGDNVIFSRTGNEWKLESGDKTYQPDDNAVKNILIEMINMKSERVAATKDSRWNEFEVTDSAATRIQLFSDGKLLSEMYVGKFNYQQPKGQQQNPYQQQKGKMSTYVREAGENEVYVVDGFLGMSLKADVNTYRNKKLCTANKGDITKLNFVYPGTNFTLIKEGDHWMINGQPADSTKTAKYLSKISRLSSSNFLDDAEALSNSPSHYVKVEGNNIIPVDLKAFPTADTNNPYTITSSFLTDSKFGGDKGKLFEKIFVDETEFFPDLED